MITENFDNYKTGGSHKEFNIEVVGTDTVIGNTNMLQESIILDEALCSDNNLKFGACEASQFSVQVANIFEDFVDKELIVSATMDGITTKYGTFKVDSDKPTADRVWRVLTCYDKMKDIINANVLEWYRGLTFPMSQKAYRDSFFTYLGIEQVEVSLINDDFMVQGGFTATDTLSGKTIITSICEFNGVFGHINRDGKFDYVSIDKASVNAPSDETYPSTVNSEFEADFECPPYENNSVTYEDYETDYITRVTMRGTASDVGTSVGVDGNEYIITNNPIIYGTEGSDELITALTRLLNKIGSISYRPYSVGKTIGNPCVELGDAITVNTRHQIINSYVVKRTLTGIQALRDKYSATGSKVYPVEVNSIREEISRTQGKMNMLNRTVDETKSQVIAIQTDLTDNYLTSTQTQTLISQSASQIQATVTQTITAELPDLIDEATGGLGDRITVVESSYTQLSNEIVMKVKSDGTLVKVALKADANTGSTFKVTADNISFFSNGVMQLTSNNLRINSTNFKVDSTGAITASNATLNGSLTTISGRSKTVINSGGIYSYYDDLLMSVVQGTVYPSGERGTTFGCRQAGKYISLSVWDASTNNFISKIILNNGLYNDNIPIKLLDTTYIHYLVLDEDKTRYINNSSWTLDNTTYPMIKINPGIYTDGYVRSGSLYVVGTSYFNGNIAVTSSGGSWISQKDIDKSAIKITTSAVTNGSRYDSIIAGKSTDGSTWSIGVMNNTIYIGRYSSSQTDNNFTNKTQIPLTVNLDLNYLSGVTSNIQTQLNNKLSLSGGTLNGSLKFALNKLPENTNPAYLCAVANDNTLQWADVKKTYVRGVKDNNNDTNITFRYSGTEMSTAAWLAAWDGYELRALKNEFIRSYTNTTYYNVTSLFTFNNSNNALVSGGKGNYIWAISAWSDSRLKKNIKDSEVNALDLINKIQMREFDFKDETIGSHQDIGYVAHELMEIIPEAVISVPVSDKMKEEYGTDEMYQVEDKYLIKYLVKAVQELGAKIQALE